MAASEFAKRQLKKHGWTEGSGLGKQEDGRSEPIKVSLKMDKTGVGHDPGKDFTDHWWLRVFNEAAQKIGKNKDNSASKNEREIKEKKLADKKNNLYKGFVKSSTLTNGVEEKLTKSDSSSDDSSDQEMSSSLPTLNDIHKFCGGATGHKAARFGIKMGGKLARVAKFDRMFEETQSQFSTAVSKTDNKLNNKLENMVEQKSSILNSEFISKVNTCENNGESKKKKKHKKTKKEKKDKYMEDARSGGEELSGDSGEKIIEELKETVPDRETIKQKHKNKKNTSDSNHIEHSVVEDSLNNKVQNGKRKKNKKRKSEADEDKVFEAHTTLKKRKKKTDKHTDSDELPQKFNNSSEPKKRKKETV